MTNMNIVAELALEYWPIKQIEILANIRKRKTHLLVWLDFQAANYIHSRAVSSYFACSKNKCKENTEKMGGYIQIQLLDGSFLLCKHPRALFSWLIEPPVSLVLCLLSPLLLFIQTFIFWVHPIYIYILRKLHGYSLSHTKQALSRSLRRR